MHLERELANAQKFAGISPGSVSYNSSILNGGGSNNLSPPELLKQPPVRTIEQCSGSLRFVGLYCSNLDVVSWKARLNRLGK